jgi:hypothetical protein
MHRVNCLSSGNIFSKNPKSHCIHHLLLPPLPPSPLPPSPPPLFFLLNSLTQLQTSVACSTTSSLAYLCMLMEVSCTQMHVRSCAGFSAFTTFTFLVSLIFSPLLTSLLFPPLLHTSLLLSFPPPPSPSPFLLFHTSPLFSFTLSSPSHSPLLLTSPLFLSSFSLFISPLLDNILYYGSETGPAPPLAAALSKHFTHIMLYNDTTAWYYANMYLHEYRQVVVSWYTSSFSNNYHTQVHGTQ